MKKSEKFWAALLIPAVIVALVILVAIFRQGIQKEENERNLEASRIRATARTAAIARAMMEPALVKCAITADRVDLNLDRTKATVFVHYYDCGGGEKVPYEQFVQLTKGSEPYFWLETKIGDVRPANSNQP